MPRRNHNARDEGKKNKKGVITKERRTRQTMKENGVPPVDPVVETKTEVKVEAKVTEAPKTGTKEVPEIDLLKVEGATEEGYTPSEYYLGYLQTVDSQLTKAIKNAASQPGLVQDIVKAGKLNVPAGTIVQRRPVEYWHPLQQKAVAILLAMKSEGRGIKPERKGKRINYIAACGHPMSVTLGETANRMRHQQKAVPILCDKCAPVAILAAAMLPGATLPNARCQITGKPCFERGEWHTEYLRQVGEGVLTGKFGVDIIFWKKRHPQAGKVISKIMDDIGNLLAQTSLAEAQAAGDPAKIKQVRIEAAEAQRALSAEHMRLLAELNPTADPGRVYAQIKGELKARQKFGVGTDDTRKKR
jgi:hypothetical protein